MDTNRRRHKTAARIGEAVFLLVFGIINLIPIFWGMVTSLKTTRDINSFQIGRASCRERV